MSLLVLGLAIAALAALLRLWPRERLSGIALTATALAYLAPAAFLAHTFYQGGDDATRFRLTLLGLGFRGPVNEAFEVGIGGDRRRHDVWISAFDRDEEAAPEIARLAFEPGAEGAPGVARLRAAAGESGGFVGVRPPRGAIRPLRRIELAAGDEVRIGGESWTVEPGAGLLGPPARFRPSAGDSVDLPLRRTRLPLVGSLPVFRPLPVTEATYALAWLRRAAGSRTDLATDNFLYRSPDGAEGTGLWLVAHDPAVAVVRGGQELEVPAEVGLAPGAAVHVLSRPHYGGTGFRAGGIRDRRSFRVLSGRRSLTLGFETPEMAALTLPQLERLRLAGGERPEGAGEELQVNLSMADWLLADRTLHFRHVSGLLAAEATSLVALPATMAEAGGDPEPRIAVTTPRGRREGRLGQPFWLGSERLAAVQFDLLSPPVLLGLLALGLAVLKSVAAESIRPSIPQRMVFGAVEALVTLRLVLGYRAWAAEPFSEEAFRLALVAWMLIPWGLMVVCIPPIGRGYGLHQKLQVRFPAFAGWCLSLAWCLRVDAPRGAVWLALHLAILAVPLVRTTGLLRALGARIEGLVEGSVESPRAPWVWLALSLVPFLLRALLLFFGVKESLSLFGRRFALSLVHVPLTLSLEALYLAWLWWRLRARRREFRWLDLAPALGFVLFGWLGPSWVVSDLGLALLNVPVFLIPLTRLSLTARAARRGAFRSRADRLFLWLPATALAAFVAFAVLPLTARALVLLFPEQTTERNYLRFLDYAYPQKLRSVALKESEQLAIMSTVMKKYTSAPFGGRGYFRSEVSPHLRSTAMREHAPSVFLASEWGVAGSIGLLLVYLVIAAAGLGLPSWRLAALREDPLDRRSSEPWRALASLTAISLAVPSVYMVLANYRLALFTGRNAFLLGLDSTADVLESALLALIFATCATIAHDRGDFD